MRIDAYRNNEQIDLVLEDFNILHIKIDVTKAHTAAKLVESNVLKPTKTIDVTDDDQVCGGLVDSMGNFNKAYCDVYHRTSDDTWLVYVSFNKDCSAVRFFFNDDVSHFTVISGQISPANDAFEYYSLVDRGFEMA